MVFSSCLWIVKVGLKEKKAGAEEFDYVELLVLEKTLASSLDYEEMLINPKNKSVLNIRERTDC